MALFCLLLGFGTSPWLLPGKDPPSLNEQNGEEGEEGGKEGAGGREGAAKGDRSKRRALTRTVSLIS